MLDYFLLFEVQIGLVLLLDLLFGDPRWMPHPVRAIGYLCVISEKTSRLIFRSETIAGVTSFVVVLSVTLGSTIALLLLLSHFSLLLAEGVSVLLLYTTIAMKDLFRHSKDVYSALLTPENLADARLQVAKIVGRDTQSLDESQICRACVETVAENMVDGITAPLFWAVVASLLSPLTLFTPLQLAVMGGMAYKAINTMDSMYGYKNSRYIRFGKTAAICDDIATFIPARLSACMLLIATPLVRLNVSDAIRIFLRDRLRHASPNGGHPESVVAGALGVQLGGPTSYFGTISDKPPIGDEKRPLQATDILTTNRYVLIATGVFVLCILLCRLLFVGM